MTNPYDPEDDPRNFAEQEPPFDPDYDQTPQDQEMLGATGDAQDGNLEKDPSEWVSGDQPAEVLHRHFGQAGGGADPGEPDQSRGVPAH